MKMGNTWYNRLHNRIFQIYFNVIDGELMKLLEKRLYEVPVEEWVKINNTFNGWEFPEQFKDLQPSWYGTSYSPILRDRMFWLHRRVMDITENKVGKKALLRYHNVESLKSMTEPEFETWWLEHGW